MINSNTNSVSASRNGGRTRRQTSLRGQLARYLRPARSGFCGSPTRRSRYIGDLQAPSRTWSSQVHGSLASFLVLLLVLLVNIISIISIVSILSIFSVDEANSIISIMRVIWKHIKCHQLCVLRGFCMLWGLTRL